ncbi:MAG TPA: DMT family transporter, partial [Bacillota bacterium]|nr:DMT family transporter [Bacillota bacterium]
VMNGLCYAIYLYMTKVLRAGSGMEPMDILFWGYVAASAAMPVVLALMPLAIKDPALTSLSFSLTLPTVLYLTGLTLGCTLLPYLLITQSLGKVELSKASLSLVLEPVSAIIISAVVLGEPIYAYHLAGGCLILLAVILVNTPKEKLLRMMGRR